MSLPPLIAATLMGDGVAQVCTTTGAAERDIGRVAGTFSSGFYVRTGEALFAVGSPAIFGGPIHLVLETSPPAPPAGSIVSIANTKLQTESCLIDLSCAVSYRPALPLPKKLRTAAPRIAQLACLTAPADDLADVWPAVRIAIDRSDLHSAGQLLEGRGSGFTPTGDDVLAGLLLFTHWSYPLSPVPANVALRAATTDTSRSFLTWAAAGQSIQPVHDLLEAAARCAGAQSISVSSFDRAVAIVSSIGGTSGKGLLAGLGLAATAWLDRVASDKTSQLPVHRVQQRS